MGSVSLHGVHHQFGGQVVLSDVSFEARSGETIGLVGPNGAGKSTLMRIVAGIITPDQGKISCTRGMRVGYLAQEPQLSPDRTLREEVATAFAHIDAWEQELHDVSDRIAQLPPGPEHDAQMRAYDRLHAQIEAAGGYRRNESIGEILSGLGFSIPDLDLPIRVLSGGQRCRAALAKLLLCDDDMLLLDEPTNHLDIDAVRWLERFLTSHRGGAVVVSHDRYLLDRIVQKIVEVDRCTLNNYPGNYSNYVAVKARSRLTQERQREKDAAYLRKERDFIAKHGAGQRSKEAKGRRTRLERRLADGEFVLEKPPAPPELQLAFAKMDPLDSTALRARGLAKSYDNKRLFADLNLQVESGTCCAITGPNGTGKTTLLRILNNLLEADDGEVSVHARATVGYYAQEAAPPVDKHSVLEALIAAHPTLSEQQARNVLAPFGFRGDFVFKTLCQLSGGEHSRLRLLMLLLETPNMLLLDEPTNHLDVTARESLEAALEEYPGTIITVSHDRYFLDRLADQLLVIRPNGHTVHAGNYSSYVEAQEQAREAAPRPTKPTRAPINEKPTAKEPAKPRATAAYDSHSLEEIETLVAEQEEHIASLNAQFASPEVYRNAEALTALRADLAEAQEKLTILESAWEERVEHH
ncbi:MAG: ABC-F family ATP-binding cassette domain-containing protein [Phycisphaerales bacterium]|nr:ABC-F family ATP-binding cassette domain-containing protein [Phycisphaerales bacterium]